MKIHAVKDHSGKVLSTFEASSGGLSIEPVLQHGEKVEEMDVASTYKEDPKVLYKN